ncbi:MAG: hypothetical protein KIT87_17970 [Anaerolineae bacterium]|nr:hypothetical protein [Anaerolineae bacterium]
MEASSVIGFDLGHGEMALTRQSITGRAEPEVLEVHGKRSQVTAVAEVTGDDGVTSVLFGEDAVEAFDLAAPETTVLEIGFKGHPSRNPKAEKSVPLLATAVYRYLLDREVIDAHQPPAFFIGCPAGWTAAERDDYEALLRQSRLPDLRVVPESLAALAHARETGALTLDQLRGPVLVIDIGSSTTDFSLQTALDGETHSLGFDLGGALIDRALLEHVLPQQTAAADLQALLQHYPSYRNRLELVCRRAKEGYFRRLDSDLYRGTDQRPVHKEIEDIQRRFVFRVTVDGPLMDTILAQPLADLGGQSWLDAFRQAAREVRDQWLTPLDLRTGVVLMTGGASRMDFIPRVCKEVFRGWTTIAGAEPDLAIARGLARWGRNYLRTTGFDAETAQFLRETLPTLIEPGAATLAQTLADGLTDGFFEAVIQPGLRDWRAHRVRTLQDLEGHLTELAQAWLQSDDARQRVNRAIAEWLKPVLARVHDALSPIMSRYGVMGDPFAILLDFDPSLVVATHMDEVAHWGELTDMVRDLVGGTSAAVLGAAFVVVQATLFRLGVTGWIVSALATGIALLIGKGVAEDYVKTMNIPYPLRGPLLSQSRIEDVWRQNRPPLQTRLREMLASSDLEAQVTQQVGQRLAEILQTRVAEIRLLIR